MCSNICVRCKWYHTTTFNEIVQYWMMNGHIRAKTRTSWPPEESICAVSVELRRVTWIRILLMTTEFLQKDGIKREKVYGFRTWQRTLNENRYALFRWRRHCHWGYLVRRNHVEMILVCLMVVMNNYTLLSRSSFNADMHSTQRIVASTYAVGWFLALVGLFSLLEEFTSIVGLLVVWNNTIVTGIFSWRMIINRWT